MLPYLPTAPFLVQESAVGGFSCKVKNAMHAYSHPLHSVFFQWHLLFVIISAHELRLRP